MSQRKLRASTMDYKHLTFIDQTIQKNAKIVKGENGKTVVYNPGWDDDRVIAAAKEYFKRDFSPVAIAAFRKKNFGRLGARKDNPLRRAFGAFGSPAPATLIARVAAVERRNEILELRISSLEEFLLDQGYRIPDLANAEQEAERETIHVRSMEEEGTHR